jgi:hypothetical protein
MLVIEAKQKVAKKVGRPPGKTYPKVFVMQCDEDFLKKLDKIAGHRTRADAVRFMLAYCIENGIKP